MFSQWKDKIFTLNADEFDSMALNLFRFQYVNNPVYRYYVDSLGVFPLTVRSVTQIPFLPIRFFKTHAIRTCLFDPQIIFESSGTSGMTNSRHFVNEVGLYKKSSIKIFESFYGPAENWCIIGVLPSYLERQNSSLVYMVNELVQKSDNSNSGFYLDEYEKLSDLLLELENKKQKTLLVGVTFALLDFAEKYPMTLQHTVIMETGGMKGRREEMVREEMHDVLKKAFNVPVVHSEYGMTELLSQAYSKGNGIFQCPPWMKIFIRDDEDPLSIQSSVNSRQSSPDSYRDGSQSHNSQPAAQGAINIIDLANLYSCCFIATDDAGKLYNNGSFEILGRMDNSDLRGCSLLSI